MIERSSGFAELSPVKIFYERFGKKSDPAIVLIMGLGMQLIAWPETLCEGLASQGFQVIRFDNRDSGLTEWLEEPRRARLEYSFMHYVMRRSVNSVYLLEDLARDTTRLLDYLEIAHAHIVGASMGGMVAQIIAAQVPKRILSMTAIMSTSGERSLPWPRWPALKLFLSRPRGTDPQAAQRHFHALFRVIGALNQPDDIADLEGRMARSVERAYRPLGTMRQMEAILASGDRCELLKSLVTPTLVIHGANDPLVPPRHGQRLTELVRDARFEQIKDMGHYLPQSVIPRLQRLILEHVRAHQPRPHQN